MLGFNQVVFFFWIYIYFLNIQQREGIVYYVLDKKKNLLLQKFSEHLSSNTVVLFPLDSNQLNLAQTLQSTQILTAKIKFNSKNKCWNRKYVQVLCSANGEGLYKRSLTSISKLPKKAPERKPVFSFYVTLGAKNKLPKHKSFPKTCLLPQALNKQTIKGNKKSKYTGNRAFRLERSLRILFISRTDQSFFTGTSVSLSS